MVTRALVATLGIRDIQDLVFLVTQDTLVTQALVGSLDIQDSLGSVVTLGIQAPVVTPDILDSLVSQDTLVTLDSQESVAIQGIQVILDSPESAGSRDTQVFLGIVVAVVDSIPPSQTQA